MPKVGTGKDAMHFPYTPAGKKKAAAAAKKTGKKLVSAKKKTMRAPKGY